MAEQLVTEILTGSDGTVYGESNTDGVLLTWAGFDALGVSEESRDKADAIAVALLKMIADAYPPSKREADKAVSVVASISRGQGDFEVDDQGNQTDYESTEVTFSLYKLVESIDLDPSNFV